MNVAVVIASGVGSRTGNHIPKQFISVYDKPIIIHDGIRPMLDRDILDSCIETCIDKGNGVTALPVYEQIFKAMLTAEADR